MCCCAAIGHCCGCFLRCARPGPLRAHRPPCRSPVRTPSGCCSARSTCGRRTGSCSSVRVPVLPMPKHSCARYDAAIALPARFGYSPTGPARTRAARTQMLAAALAIRFVWLPKQAPELNAMDQLWRELKRLIAANRQATSVNALASDAADWVLGLNPQQARRKAGMASEHFWLRNLVGDFWPPT